MNSGIPLIRSLATTLLSEIDSLNDQDKAALDGNAFDLSQSVREFEIKLIRTALMRTGGNQRRAAAMLGVKPTTLNSKIKHYGIDYMKMRI